MKFVDIKNDIAFRKIPSDLNDNGLKEAYADANQNTWSQAELDAYNYSAMREQDDRGRMEKSLLKGIEKGKEEAETEFVIEMHKDGLTIDRIAKIAKISVEKVEEIIKKHKNTEGGKE